MPAGAPLTRQASMFIHAFTTERLTMSTLSSDKRPRLSDIVRGNAADFQKIWDATEASAGIDPLPPGVYRCLITDGRLFTSRTNSTPGFKVEFQVIVGPFAGRKVWHDIWLSSRALPVAKAELAKLGITSPDQLEQPLPPGLTADVTVVQRADDNGTTFNRVRTFKIVDADVPADNFTPDEQRASEADDASTPLPALRATREPGEDDDLDTGESDWRQVVQVRHTSSAPLFDAVSNGRSKAS
jgi:hypothetical protein